MLGVSMFLLVFKVEAMGRDGVSMRDDVAISVAIQLSYRKLPRKLL